MKTENHELKIYPSIWMPFAAFYLLFGYGAFYDMSLNSQIYSGIMIAAGVSLVISAAQALRLWPELLNNIMITIISFATFAGIKNSSISEMTAWLTISIVVLGFSLWQPYGRLSVVRACLNLCLSLIGLARTLQFVYYDKYIKWLGYDEVIEHIHITIFAVPIVLWGSWLITKLNSSVKNTVARKIGYWSKVVGLILLALAFCPAVYFSGLDLIETFRDRSIPVLDLSGSSSVWHLTFCLSFLSVVASSFFAAITMSWKYPKNIVTTKRCKILIATKSVKGLFLMKDLSRIGCGSVHELNMLEIEHETIENQYDFKFVEAIGKEQTFEKISESSAEDPVHAIVVFCSESLGLQDCIEILEKGRDKGIELRFVISESDDSEQLSGLAEVFKERGNQLTSKFEEGLSQIFS